jgi:hypothetical protein
MNPTTSRYGPVVGFCEYVNKPMFSIKGGEFTDSSSQEVQFYVP